MGLRKRNESAVVASPLVVEPVANLGTQAKPASMPVDEVDEVIVL